VPGAEPPEPPPPPPPGYDQAWPSPTPPPPSDRPGFVLPRWVVAIVLVLVVTAAGYAIGYATAPDSSSSSSAASPSPANPNQPSTPSTTNPPNTPANQALAGLVVGQSDLPSSYAVQLIPGGNQVGGETTLDLCNASYPSEALRTNRLQVAALAARNVGLSTEAVLYQTPAASAQAFSELRAAAASCPSTPVRSPVGEPTVTTTFGSPPDGGWPAVPGVQRLAYAVTTTDQQGTASSTIAVYLSRGRALLGVYFADPSNVPTVAGQTTVAGIVNLFAQRLAQLPDSVVNG
jgi:hypothetical protein